MTKDATTIVEGQGDSEQIKGRVGQLKAEIENTDSDYDRGAAERLAKLAGGVALIKVGAATEVELGKKHRIEDAVSATRAAIEEGTVAGGGVALIQAEEAIDVDALGLAGDEATGALIVRRSLQEPAKLIAGGAGFEGRRGGAHPRGVGCFGLQRRHRQVGRPPGWPESSTPPRSPGPPCRMPRRSRGSCCTTECAIAEKSEGDRGAGEYGHME